MVGFADRQSAANNLHDKFDIVDDLRIPETQHAMALRFDMVLASHVGGVAMLAAIDFDDELLLAANEIGDERSDGDLPAELEAIKLAGTQRLPKPAF